MKFPATLVTTVRKFPVHWTRSAQPMPSPTYFVNISLGIILTSTRLPFPSGIFPLRFSTKNLHAHLLSFLWVTRQTHSIILDFTILIIFGVVHSSWSSRRIFLQYSATSSPSDPNILLRNQSSKTTRLRSPLKMNDKVTRPFKTTVCFTHYRNTNHAASKERMIIN
jgi:hypothetical protein